MLNRQSLRGTSREPGRRKRSLALYLEQFEDRTMLSSAAFAVTSDWGSGFGGQITITNSQSTAVKNWSLSFDWDRSITDIWNGSISSHTGNHYVITNAGWNSTIAPNATAQFGFNGSPGKVGSDVPANYALNGVALGGGALPSLSINDVTVNDGPSGATAQFTVSLSAAAAGTVTVGYGTVDGTAKAGTDFKAASGTLSFSPGTLSQTIAVPILPDTTVKPNQTFQVNLTNPVGATLADGAGTGTIVDTVEPPPSPTSASASFQVTSDWGTGFCGQITIGNNQSTPVNNWTLSFSWDRSITQIWDATITSHTGNQYVITSAGWNASIPGNGSVSFGFNGAPGNVGSDVPTNYVLNGTALGAGVPSISINNVTVNDGTAGATATFTVSLSQASTSPVTVNYATSDGTARAGTDYKAASGTLTFSPGTVSKTISVTVLPDTTAKPNETFSVALSGATNAVIATSSGTGTIVDTIGAPPVTAGDWPKHVFAPYVDMTLYPMYNLITAVQTAGHQVFHSGVHHG